MAKAKVAAKEAKDAHNYTDTAGFTLKYVNIFSFGQDLDLIFSDVLCVVPDSKAKLKLKNMQK